ncbi:S8 family serine peptidase [Deinococcus altitudinis]|uniref:S8 family serine peptidase n=1 Tax=Deinococcus altitudinis TaxID=468914 RepID=UPI0038923B0C
MKTHLVQRSAVLLLSGLLAACGQQASVPAAHYAQVLTLHLKGGETSQGLGQKYNGTVLVFKPNEHLALIATNGLPSSLGTLGLNDHSEPNIGRIRSSAGATIWTKAGATIWTKAGATIWTKAGATIWTKAGATIWTKGTYEPVPENTTNWSSVHLDSAQARLARLGTGVKVAVVDTGVDLNLSFFQGSLAPASEWRDYVDGDRTPNEVGTQADHGYGHGTGIAGTILQISPGATILPMRVLGPDGGGDVISTAQAIIDAADLGANVINLSLGMPEVSPAIEAATLYAEGKGVVVVTSSGNDGASTLDFPARGAADDSARLAVGSVDDQGQISAFSNVGAGLSVFAPGEMIYGPAPEEAGAAWSGTSQSAAVTSGAVALGLGEGAAPAAVRAALLNTVSPVHTADAAPVTGAGQLDLGAFAQVIVP